MGKRHTNIFSCVRHERVKAQKGRMVYYQELKVVGSWLEQEEEAQAVEGWRGVL
jgi:hypothetical protein